LYVFVYNLGQESYCTATPKEEPGEKYNQSRQKVLSELYLFLIDCIT